MALEERAEEIAKFLNISMSTTMDCMKQGSIRAKKLWDKANPQTEEERRKWYQETDAYIFESSFWYEADRSIQELHKWIIKTCMWTGGRILDFGAGIGELIIQLALHDNIKPVYMDLNSLTSDFAKFRLDERGLLDKVEFVTTKGEPDLSGLYSIVYTLDTLEHLDDPFGYVDTFIDYLPVGGKLILEYSLDFTERYPMHLEKYVKRDLMEMDHLIKIYLSAEGIKKRADLPYRYPGGVYVKERLDVHS